MADNRWIVWSRRRRWESKREEGEEGRSEEESGVRLTFEAARRGR